MSDSLKRRLFDCGVQAARHIGKHSGELYFCPLCGRGFSRNALDPEAPQERRLTKEDVPPKSHPGRSDVLMLTCCGVTPCRWTV